MTAEATCPQCGEHFVYERHADEAKPPWPQDWYAYVVHVHEPVSVGEDAPSSEGDGVWHLALFHRLKGGRYPEGAKVIMGEQKAQRKELMTAKKIKKDSSGARDHVVR